MARRVRPRIEQLEHRAGVVREPADDGEVHLDELAEAHRIERVHHATERLARLRPAWHPRQRLADGGHATPARRLEDPVHRRAREASAHQLLGQRGTIDPLDLVHRLERRRQLALDHAGAEQERPKHAPVGEPHPHVPRSEAERAHDVDRQRDDLRVAERTRLADQVAVELEVLSKPPPLLPLVAEQLGNGEPADRLLEPVGPGGHHAGEGGRHFRAQRHLAPALVDEIVQLAHDLVAALGRVQLQRLERRAVVLLEPVPRGHRPPGTEDVRAQRKIGGVELPKARQGLGLHGENIVAPEEPTPPPSRARSSHRRRCGTSRSRGRSRPPAAPGRAPR